MTSRLPLFPLSAVSFPGMPTRLHIFEDRYKEMLKDCLDSDRKFATTLIRRGQEVSDNSPELYPVGCILEIFAVQEINDGRMNVIAMGADRFMLNDLSHDKPYLTAELKVLHQDNGNAELSAQELSEQERQLRHILNRYTVEILKGNDEEIRSVENAANPWNLGYLGASLWQGNQVIKQELLTYSKLPDLLRRITGILRDEMRLNKLANQGKNIASLGPYSNN
jgi:uncharacterized protein